MSSTTVAPQTKNKPSPCKCHDAIPSPCTCCGLTCFERPNYFCGHLLTDADLSLEQKYVVEKNKLHHRAIDGYGVACGLKITCDHHCCGHVWIHQGYAIDDCGNDLVVCEPTRFDVIGTLQKKGLLLVDPPEDDCAPKRQERHCKIKQCFYLTICYGESQSNYETPFQSSCTSGPKACLPTRCTEGVCFDLTDKLPPHHSYLKDLEKEFEECFKITCEGEIGRIMKHPHLRRIVCGEFKREHCQEYDPCEQFCTLRAWFLNHLKSKPDEYNCGLFAEVQCLTCPGDYDGEEDDEQCWKEYLGEVQEAFRKLIYYIERYQFDCALGHLVFDCKQPCEAHCLVLGTVEVVDGKLMRVCNTPRHYLWAAANLLPVSLYYLLNKRAWPGRECDEHDEHDECRCCPSYPHFKPERFLEELEEDRCGRFLASIAPLRAIEAVVDSLQRAFDFSDTGSVPMALLERLLRQKEPNSVLGVDVAYAEKAPELSRLSPIQTLLAHLPLRGGDRVIGVKEGGTVKRVLPDFFADVSPDRRLGERIERLPYDTQNELETLTGKLQRLQEQIDTLTKEVQGTAEKKPRPGKKEPIE